MDIRAEVAVLVPVSMATRMCCRCSDASWEHYAAAVLTWATRASAQLTALSIRQSLFIAPKWRLGGTQAAQSVGQGGQAPKNGWVLTQDWMAPLDEVGWMHGETEGWTHGKGCVILSLISVHTDEKWHLAPRSSQRITQILALFRSLNIQVCPCAGTTCPQIGKQSTQAWWGREGWCSICIRQKKACHIWAWYREHMEDIADKNPTLKIHSTLL